MILIVIAFAQTVVTNNLSLDSYIYESILAIIQLSFVCPE